MNTTTEEQEESKDDNQLDFNTISNFGVFERTLSRRGQQATHILRHPDSAIEQIAKADPNNIQEVAASQLAIINSYYQSGLQQSQQSFRWSLIWGGIGFGFLIVAVGVLLFSKPTEIALASEIAGALVEIFAGTYLYLYKHASDQLAAFRTSLERTQHLLLANTMCEKLEGDTEQTTRADIIRLMVNSAVNRQVGMAANNEKKTLGK